MVLRFDAMGTAAGAAKARERIAQKAAAREQSETILDSANISASASTPVTLISPDGLMATDAATIQSKGQELTSALVDAHGPEAVSVLVQSMRQRKSPTLRFSAACKLIDLSLLRDRGGAPGAAETEEHLLTRIGDALNLRGRAARAVDAVQVGEDPVTPATVDHSTQQPDS